MGYSDQKYYDRPLIKVAAAVAYGTATASGTASNSLAQPAATQLETFLRRTKVVGLEAVCVTAPGGTQVGPINLTILNGTATVASVAVQTATVGQTVYVNTNTAVPAGGTYIGTNATFAAFSAPVSALIGTFTASAATSGTWDIWLEVQEQFDTPGQASS
jgi:hypothetical protein